MENMMNKQSNQRKKGLCVLLYTEMWELFGRFGISATLVLYLTKMMHFSDAESFAVYSGFIALIFMTPIIGGVLCDRVLGNRHGVILGIVVMLIGNLFLVIPQPNMVYLWPGYRSGR